jgi:leader peptidase (prepilin peptidase)/N-methyltransferase
MEITMGLFLFIFGAIIGSFLNVVILRHNTGKSLAGRSGCMVCGASLRPIELVPMLSFVFQQGRCTQCKSGISWQYLLVELSTAVLFVLAGIYTYVHFGLTDLLLSSIILAVLLIAMSILVILTVYDYKHTILPDRYTYGFIILATLFSAMMSTSEVDFGWSLFGGLTTALPIFSLWFFSGGRAMGFGDVKLSVGIGIFLGVYLGISAVWYAFVIGALFGIVLLALRKAGPKSEVAFGPFLILGFLTALFTQVGFLEVVTNIMMLV